MADNVYNLNFEMTDGTTKSVSFTSPQGPQGEKGDAGNANVATATGCTIGDDATLHVNYIWNGTDAGFGAHFMGSTDEELDTRKFDGVTQTEIYLPFAVNYSYLVGVAVFRTGSSIIGCPIYGTNTNNATFTVNFVGLTSSSLQSVERIYISADVSANP